MPVRKLLSHMDSAFIKEEDTRSTYFNKVLGNIESWLLDESKIEERFSQQQNSAPDIELRKLSLLNRLLAKDCEFVGMLSLEKNGKARPKSSILNSKKVMATADAMDVGRLSLETWYPIKANLAIKYFPFLKCLPPRDLYIRRAGASHAFVIYSELPTGMNSALLSKLATQIDRIK